MNPLLRRPASRSGVLSLFPFSFFLFSFSVLLFPFSFSGCETTTTEPPPPPEAPDTLALIREAFADPRECAACHPNHYNEWQQSMHAYAITDPVFRKLVAISRQRSTAPTDQFCIKCHSPLAPLLGEAPPGFDFDNFSALSKNAVFCDVCHTMNTAAIESGLSLQARHFHLDRTRRSTIADPQENSFHTSAFDPEFNFSRVCSPCHNIKAPEGNFFLEETNIEWDESPFLAMGVECQDCHMPVYSGQAALGGPQRDDLNRHTFVGVDYPLVDFPGKEETIAAVRQMLENAVTLTLTAPASAGVSQPLKVEVRIKNDKTGHNIPSGSIFERQMWIELVVLNLESGDTLFASGLLDSRGDLRNHHSADVNEGRVPPDTSLVLFRGIPQDESGRELMFFWEARKVQKNTIPAFQSFTATYHLQAPPHPAVLEARVRLRFRAFPPYFLREIDEEALIPELRIFEMAEASQIIRVAN